MERKYTPSLRESIDRTSPVFHEKSQEVIEGMRLEVPRFNIFGIQPIQEYSSKTERRVRAALKSQGKEYLYKNPVDLCAMSGNGIITLALLDGHHRTRFAGCYGITTIPSIIYTPEQALEWWNNNPRNQMKFDSPIHLQSWLQSGITEAMSTFQTMKDSKQPRFIPYAESIQDLSRRFASF